MPIGKNSLKRVTNNGYSKVQSSAPDMQNSEVSLIEEAGKHTEEILSPKTEEGKAAIARAKEKVSAVKEAKKKTESKPKAAEKVAPSEKAKETVKSMKAEEKKTVKSPAKKSSKTVVKKAAKSTEIPAVSKEFSEPNEERTGTGYINLGGNLPYYLL